MRWAALLVVVACHAQPRPTQASIAPDGGEIATIVGNEIETDDTPANLGDAGPVLEGTPGGYSGFGSGVRETAFDAGTIGLGRHGTTGPRGSGTGYGFGNTVRDPLERRPPKSALVFLEFTVIGSVTRDEIKESLDRDLLLVGKKCETPLRKLPRTRPFTTFSMSFRIQPDGTPTDIHADGDADATACLVDAAARFLYFPKPPDGKPVSVSGKLMFDPR